MDIDPKIDPSKEIDEYLPLIEGEEISIELKDNPDFMSFDSEKNAMVFKNIGKK